MALHLNWPYPEMRLRRWMIWRMQGLRCAIDELDRQRSRYGDMTIVWNMFLFEICLFFCITWLWRWCVGIITEEHLKISKQKLNCLYISLCVINWQSMQILLEVNCTTRTECTACPLCGDGTAEAYGHIPGIAFLRASQALKKGLRTFPWRTPYSFTFNCRPLAMVLPHPR